MIRRDGCAVVLTADRSLMAGYRVLLDGMMAASQTTSAPRSLIERLLAPRAPSVDGRVSVAPLGLRRIEAALVASGFTRDEVIVADDAGLREAIGPATRVVGVSSGEPVGRGMSSSTMVGVVGGDIYPLAAFRTLMTTARALLKDRAPRAKVVLGGPGSWQVAHDPLARQALGVDCVVTGYAEGNAAELFATALDGTDLPSILSGESVDAGHIPPILGPSTMGVVEVSRGCGLGCQFCTIAMTPMCHLPLETILADAQTNLAGGNPNVALLSEDLWRWGGQGMRCNPDAVLGLLAAVRSLRGLRAIQVDHANVASIAQFSEEQLIQARALLVGRGRRRPWVNLGVESSCGELLAANGGLAKMGGVSPELWGEFAAEQIRRLCAAGFSPMVSLIVGLPEETEEHVQADIAWTRALAGLPVTIFPVLYAPIHGEPALDVSRLGKSHWRLLRQCYEMNYQGVARIFWDDQTDGGVSLSKRALLQLLGKGQALQWRALLGYRLWRAAP